MYVVGASQLEIFKRPPFIVFPSNRKIVHIPYYIFYINVIYNLFDINGATSFFSTITINIHVYCSEQIIIFLY